MSRLDLKVNAKEIKAEIDGKSRSIAMKVEGQMVVFMWIAEEDVATVEKSVLLNGELVDGWDEDPEETGEPYTFVEEYKVGDVNVELFLIPTGKNTEKVLDIRVIIPVTEEEISEVTYETLPLSARDRRLISAFIPEADYIRKMPLPTSPKMKKVYFDLMKGAEE